MRFATGLLLFATAAGSAEPMHVLIFSGGKTEDDAKKALESFKRLEPALSDAVTLSAGEPRIIESSKLPGLTAGFWIVTLGRCRAPGPALAAIKAVYPGAYAKPLTGEASAETCPALSEKKVSAVEATLKTGGRSLSAFSVLTAETDERGADVSGDVLHFVLVDKASGQVLDLAQTAGGGTGASGSEGPVGREYESCSANVSTEKAALVVVRTCTSQRTGCNRGEKKIPTGWTETERVTVSGDKLSVSKPKTVVTDATDCN